MLNFPFVYSCNGAAYLVSGPMDLVTLRTVQFIYLTNKCHSIDSTATAVTSLHCRVHTNHSAAFTHKITN